MNDNENRNGTGIPEEEATPQEGVSPQNEDSREREQALEPEQTPGDGTPAEELSPPENGEEPASGTEPDQEKPGEEEGGAMPPPPPDSGPNWFEKEQRSLPKKAAGLFRSGWNKVKGIPSALKGVGWKSLFSRILGWLKSLPARCKKLPAFLKGGFQGKAAPLAFIIGMALVLAVGLWTVYVVSISPDKDAPVIPASGDVKVDTSKYDYENKVIIRGGGLTLESLRESISVSPSVEYRLYALEGGSFELRLLNPSDRKYTITFDDMAGEKQTATLGEDGEITRYGKLSLELIHLNPRQVGINETLTIELSHPVGYDEVSQYLKVEPEFSYYLDFTGDTTLTITPYSSLKNETEYTLTFRSGMMSYDGMNILDKDAEVVFRTQRESFSILLTNRSAETLTLQKDLEMEFDMKYGEPDYNEEGVDWSYQDKGVPVVVTLYRFPTMDKYLSQSKILMNYNVPLTMLEMVDVDVHILEKGLNEYVLPNPGVGAYLALATITHPETGEEMNFRKVFTVSDLSIYAQTNLSQTLVWGNSSVTSAPLTGYSVEFYKSEDQDPVITGQLDSEGITVMDYIDQEALDNGYYSSTPARIITMRDAAGELVYVDNTSVLNQYTSASSGANRYYAFFHTDRTLYKPDDEINFWGFIKPYSQNTDPIPSTARIVLGEDSLNESVDVDIQPDGTFIGTIDLESVRSSHYSLAFKLPAPVEEEEESQVEELEEEEAETEEEQGSGGEQPSRDVTIRSIYVQVKEFEKPTYTISSEVDRDYYMPDEDVTVTITPTFYDGTPMPEYDLEFQVYDSYYGDVNFNTKVTTDDSGVATVTFPANQRRNKDEVGWTPSTNRYMVRIADDGENITHNGSYTYFPTHIFYTSEFEENEDGSLSVQVGAYEIDRDKLTKENVPNYISTYYQSGYHTYTSEMYDAFRGDPREMFLEIVAEYYYYDEDGEYHSGSKEYEGTTSAEGLFDIDFSFGKDRDPERYASFSIVIRGVDDLERTVAGRGNWYKPGVSSYKSQYDDMRFVGYSFAVTNAAGEDELADFVPYMTYNEATFGDGEVMNFRLNKAFQPVENEGKILYTLVQNEILERNITTADSFQITQSTAYANSVNVVAAYFDGTAVYPIRNTVVTFFRESASLEVEVTPDREEYEPGEQVTLSVRVTDVFGNGVSSTTVIGVVDEAIFDLQEQSVNVLESLYRDFYFSHYNVKKYTTTNNDHTNLDDFENIPADGGKGGGDDLMFLENLRKNFKDTALFQQVRTDSSGNATLTFTLPDNVTSWRITSASVTENIYGGHSKLNFVTTMPFFLSPVISSKYIEGDDVAMRIQAHGVALDGESEIDYTVNVRGDGVDETRVAQGVAFQSIEMNFGKLPEGEYTVTALATSGEYSDAVEVTLAVIASNLELVISRNVDMDALQSIQAIRYPVTVTFYNKEHEAYYSSISSLMTHYCMQASQRMSRFVGKRALTQYMDPADIPQHILADSNDSAADMQNADGGIGHYVGGKSDPLLTPKVLIVARDQFDLELMTTYFREVLADTRDIETIASCYLGLGVIGDEDAQREIHEMLDEYDEAGREMSQFLRLYLIAALAYLEDDRAVELYEQYITPHMTARDEGKYYKASPSAVTAGSSRYSYTDDRLTAAAWIAASRMRTEDADAISLYFANYSWRISTLWECMIYVTHYDKEVLPQSFTYSANGQTQTVNLGMRGSQTLTFNKSQFETLEVLSSGDEITARAYFIGEPSEADIQPSELLSIKKEVVNVGNKRYRVLLTIDFEDDAPTGQYDVSEWIPSNMRLYTVGKDNRGSGDRWYYNYSTEGQKIYFTVYRHTNTNQIQLWYTAQRTFEAEAIIDSTYIIHGDTGENNLSPRVVME